MITEQILLDAVRTLFGRSSTITQKFDLDDEGGKATEKGSTEQNSTTPGHLIRTLLPRYSLLDIEAAIRWLEIGGYISYTGFGALAPRMLAVLTPKGVKFAQDGHLEESERGLVYQEDPYAVFVAYQFSDEDAPLFSYLSESILAPAGFRVLDGRVEGVEAFRGEIVRKIRLARFFVCLLTRREELRAGRFASSVWLYQETGAAVALGKKPLILVEDGLSDHYAGELQKNYEYIPFSRGAYCEAFATLVTRVKGDLVTNHIQPPATLPRKTLPETLR